MAKIWKNNGLTIVLMALFLAAFVGQWLSGWRFENEELARHGEAVLSLSQYTTDPHFISAVFENWESEFLQMSAYVVLTAFLFQKGSAESADPDAEARPGDSATAGQWLYAHSLGIVLLLLFASSFILHWTFSAQAAAAEAASHGEPVLTTGQYLASAQLWFESFQNWQSEFLSTAVLIVLSIFLRQKGSPESKPVNAPHSQTGTE